MAKQKKKKTPTQKRRQYKAISYTCFGCEFLSIFAPFVTIGIVKYDDYFVQYNGTKMSIAAILAAALMGIATWLVAKKKFNTSFISLIIGWFALDFIAFLLGKIINDIAWIMLYGGLGIIGAYGLNIASEKADEKAEEITKAIKKAQEDINVEEYKEELKDKEENKKVRF